MLENCHDIFSSGMQQVLFVQLVSDKFLMQLLIRVNKCLLISCNCFARQAADHL